jgi:hypothetical protein
MTIAAIARCSPTLPAPFTRRSEMFRGPTSKPQTSQQKSTARKQISKHEHHYNTWASSGCSLELCSPPTATARRSSPRASGTSVRLRKSPERTVSFKTPVLAVSHLEYWTARGEALSKVATQHITKTKNEDGSGCRDDSQFECAQRHCSR